MNKTDLVSAIASKSGLNKKNSEAALNAFISTVQDTLKRVISCSVGLEL
jgi:DNA-binding protein HU-beta